MPKEVCVRSFFLICVFGLLFASQAQAHRVNVFAFVEGNEIVVECSYSKSHRVRGGKIEVQDALTHEILLKGTTNDAGEFRFPIPDSARKHGSDLRIVLKAGEGHQNDWLVAASEFVPAGTVLPVTKNAPNSEAQTVPPVRVAEVGSLTQAEVRGIVEAALDAKLAPIKRAILEQTEAGPGLRDIIGGLGWIFGLAGLGLYWRARK